jgi:hypothetical protein
MAEGGLWEAWAPCRQVGEASAPSAAPTDWSGLSDAGADVALGE